MEFGMNVHIWWYLSRASGIVAWLTLTLSVLWGIILSTDLFPRRRRPAWLLDLHRWLGAMTLCFVAIHLGTLVADSYTHFAARELLIPFASAWRPTAVALGVFAVYLLVAVELTALAMKRLSKRWWRDVHIASYGVFWLTSIHAALSGTDSGQQLYTITALVAMAAIVFAVCYRILSRDLPKRRAKRAPPRPAQRAAGSSTPATTD
jgi:sulfoxide reductase heme-binding subunit YedZ